MEGGARALPGPRWVADVVASISATPIGLALVLLGPLAEAVALGRGSENVYEAGGLTAPVALASLGWAWLTGVWLATVVSRAAHERTRGWSRPARVLLLGGLAALGEALALAYLASWYCFLHTGQFASWESLRFVLATPPGLGGKGVEGGIFAHEVAAGLPVAAPLLALAPVAALLLGRGRPWASATEPRALAQRRRYAWYACGFVVGGLLIALKRDEAETRVGLRLDTLRRRLNPAVALGFTLAEALEAEPVSPCLEPRDLRPRSAPWHPGAVPEGARTVVLVKLESARADVLGTGVLPTLDALARESLVFTRAYANATHTDYSDPAVHSSLYPLRTRLHHYNRATDPWPRVLLHDALHEGGFATAIASSQDLRWGRQDLFLRTPGLDRLEDAAATTAPASVDARDSGYAAEARAGAVRGNVDDAETVTNAVRWLEAQGEKPVFLALDLQRSHFPYTAPREHASAGQASSGASDGASFLGYPPAQTPALRQAYEAALGAIDAQIARVVAALRRLGRFDRSILVVYGDHGEMFHERPGYVTHSREPYDLLVRVPCLVRAPALVKPGRDDYPLELVDLAPTVLGLLGWEAHPAWQGTALLGPAPRPALEGRAVFLVCDSPIAVADAIVEGGRWKLLRDRNRARQELYDLEQDPGETHDLGAREPERVRALAGRLDAWRRRQLAYHAFDFYYERSFAPCPPERP